MGAAAFALPFFLTDEGGMARRVCQSTFRQSWPAIYRFMFSRCSETPKLPNSASDSHKTSGLPLASFSSSYATTFLP